MFNTVLRNTMQKYLQDYEANQLNQEWAKFLDDYANHIRYYGYDDVNKDTARQVYMKGLSSDIRLFF